MESTSERIKAGLEWVSVAERSPGRTLTLTPKQLRECPWMYVETPSIRWVTRFMKVFQRTVRRALEFDVDQVDEKE